MQSQMSKPKGILVIPAPIFIGINSSRNPSSLEKPSGFPPEFTPYLLRGGNDRP